MDPATGEPFEDGQSATLTVHVPSQVVEESVIRGDAKWHALVGRAWAAWEACDAALPKAAP